MELSISRRRVLKDLSRSRGAFGWWEEDEEKRKKRSALLERARNIERKTRPRVGAHPIACDYVTGNWSNSLPPTHCTHTLMDRATEHERPANRVKRDGTEAASTPPPSSHGNEDLDMEESGFVPDNNAAHGSDLYLDTVWITSSVHLRNLKHPSGKSCHSRL